MTAPFTGALGVVRVRFGPEPEAVLATLPAPVEQASRYAAALVAEVGVIGDTARFVEFDTGPGLGCWIRARDVIAIDVVPTEDPGVDR